MTDHPPHQPRHPAPPDEEKPDPGPLGFLELTFEIMRDRSHSSWMFLGDEELLRALRTRGTVAAYLPGEEVATPDLVTLRVAVSPDGHVVSALSGQPPEAGEVHVHEWLPQLLDELKTVASVGPGDLVGPPWLPVEETVAAARRPTEAMRSVYCYRGTETLAARAFARDLGMPLSVRVEDGWVVCATPHAPEKIFTGPPARLTGAYPFAVLQRKGRRRLFVYIGSARADALSVSAEWGPPLRAVPPEDAHPDTLELGRWLADPAAWERTKRAAGELPAAHARELPTGMTPEQDGVLTRWMEQTGDADGFLTEAATAFGVPVVAAELALTAAGDADPPGGRTVAPQRGAAMVSGAVAEQDTEPEGRTPWSAVSRLLWRRPPVGLALGVTELLLSVLLAVLVVSGDRAWWWWVLVAVLVLAGFGHAGAGLLRLHWRRGQESAPQG